MTKNNKYSLIWKLSLLLVSSIKIILTYNQKVYAIGEAIHDDRLFVNLATKLIRGIWLGGYNNKTLVKGPMYPIFIALNYYLGLPLLLSQQLLYIGAGLILVIALKRVVKNKCLLFFLYCIYLFNPMTFHPQMMRVVREGIYPALTVLVFACAIGMLAWHKERTNSFTLWSVSLGVSLSAFWLTREEGLWILPSLFLIIGFILLSNYRYYRLSLEFLRRSLVCVLPFLVLFLSLQAVALLNKIIYGTYTVVEFKSDSFVAAYGALSRVKPPCWRRYVPVPQEARRLIYEVSPAFKELQPYLEGDLGRQWTTHGRHLAPGDMAGGWFMWALRDAAALAGHHTSGAAADRFYRRLAREVNEACDQGLLPCLPARKTMMPPMRPEYLRLMGASFKEATTFLINFTGFQAIPPPSIGDESSLNLFRRVTHNELSDDTFNPEEKETGEETLVKPVHWQFSKILMIENIAYIYQKTMHFLFYFCLLYFVITITTLFYKKLSYIMLINFAILIAIFTRIAIISFIDATSFNAITVLYLSPIYPLMLIFISLTLISISYDVYEFCITFSSRQAGA